MSEPQWKINVAERVADTRAEGPGRRYALWVQGCPLRCPGCCNPEMLEFRSVQWYTVDQLLDEVLAQSQIEGVTFIGGEPFAQAEALGELALRLRCHGLSVMVFSGYRLEHLRSSSRPGWLKLLLATDLLVDGLYLQKRAVDDRRWIGSSNQRVHFLTPRYRHMSEDADGWDRGRNTVELRLVNGQVQINGFPHQEKPAS